MMFGYFGYPRLPSRWSLPSRVLTRTLAWSPWIFLQGYTGTHDSTPFSAAYADFVRGDG